jgi:hypothetical protein
MPALFLEISESQAGFGVIITGISNARHSNNLVGMRPAVLRFFWYGRRQKSHLIISLSI